MVRIRFPPAESPSLFRNRFRRSRTPAFRAGVRGWFGDRVGRDAPRVSIARLKEISSRSGEANSELAGHSSLATTQRYIQGDTAAAPLMPGGSEHDFALRQADAARDDFAAIQDDLASLSRSNWRGCQCGIRSGAPR
jgi:hypothetical protein